MAIIQYNYGTTPESEIVYSPTTGHHHTGTDSRKIAYSDLDSTPSTFTPSAHGSSSHSGTIGTESEITMDDSTGHAHTGADGKGTKVSYVSLSNIPSTFVPASHGSSAHSGTIGTESEITFDDSSGHTHAGSTNKGTKISYANLDNIPSTFTPASHGASAHTGTIGTESEITFADTGGHAHTGTSNTGTKIAYSDLSSIPSSFTPASHQLDSATYHTVSGLTTGHVLTALSATTFGFQAPADPSAEEMERLKAMILVFGTIV